MALEYASDVDLDRAVLYVLHQHKGQDEAISRWLLVEQIFGADVVTEPLQNNDNPFDRQVRQSIERWRAKGQHLCNVGNGSGYYVANTRDEYEQFKRYYLGAAFRKLEVAKVMDETADKRWGLLPRETNPAQASMFGMEARI